MKTDMTDTSWGPPPAAETAIAPLDDRNREPGLAPDDPATALVRDETAKAQAKRPHFMARLAGGAFTGAALVMLGVAAIGWRAGASGLWLVLVFTAACVFGGIGFFLGGFLSALKAADEGLGSLRDAAVAGAAAVIQRATERYELLQKPLPFDKVDEVLSSWSSELEARVGDRKAYKISKWLVVRLTGGVRARLRSSLLDTARSRGQTAVTLSDLQTVLCARGLDGVIEQVRSHLAWIRRAILVVVAGLACTWLAVFVSLGR